MVAVVNIVEEDFNTQLIIVLNTQLLQEQLLYPTHATQQRHVQRLLHVYQAVFNILELYSIQVLLYINIQDHQI